MNSVFTRRRAIGLGLAALAGGTAAACGSAPPPASGPAWTYTDARGRKITVSPRPARIVAYSGLIGALADYGVPFVGVFGPHSPINGKPNPQSGDAKFAGVPSAGEQYGDFSVEKLLALKPDLVMDTSFVAGQPFYIPKNVLGKLEQAVPVALVDTSQHNTLPVLLDTFTQLATSLGGVIDAPQQRAAHEKFDKATAAIRSGLARNPNLRVLFISGAPAHLFVVRPDSMVGTKYLTSLGMKITDPPHVGANDYFTQISWEQLGNFPADVVLYDARPQAMTKDQLMAQPTFRDLPAVKANQVAPWNPEVPFSYQQWGKALTPVSKWVGQYRAGLV